MVESPTLRVHRCLERLRRGEASAREELIRAACDRMQRLTRKMMRDFARVRRWEETGDVYQNAMLRLCRALEGLIPETPADYFRLAALQIRRELIDLARRYYGPEGHGANHASHHESPDSSEDVRQNEPVDEATNPETLAGWTEFHHQAGKLPPEEREVFDLLWYQGLKQAEAAELLGVAERTIKRRWQSARLMLYEAMKGRMPEL